MKGVVFNIVEDVLTEAMSADAWENVVASSGVSGAYTSLGTYPDAEMLAIIESTAAVAGLTADDTLRLVGRHGFKHLARRAPHVLDGLDSWRQVLMSLDGIIHPEVLKIYPDAEVPAFDAAPDGDDLVVVYSSPRRLCALADGLMRGAGEWFGIALDVQHESCAVDGDADCRMRVSETTSPEHGNTSDSSR